MRRLLAPLVALLLIGAFPVSVSASVTQYAAGSCTMHWHAHGDVVPYVCLTESIDFGGDKLVFTASSDEDDLRDIAHAPTGLCSPKLNPLGDDWNDCISAVWVKLGTNDSVCLYGSQSWHDVRWVVAAPAAPAGGIFSYSEDNLSQIGAQDITSAVMVQESGTDCGEGGV